MVKNYQVVELSFYKLYTKGTTPEGRIFTYINRHYDNSLPDNWKTAHLKEIAYLLADKWLISEESHQNCGLIKAARHFFQFHTNDLFKLAQIGKISLPELSLVIKEQNKSRIFIPSWSISKATTSTEPIYHKTLESFFNSNSYNLLRNIAQYTAANPDSTLDPETQSNNFTEWVSKNGQLASILLNSSLSFDPELNYVEGSPSPDEVLKDLGHKPYEELAIEKLELNKLEEVFS